MKLASIAALAVIATSVAGASAQSSGQVCTSEYVPYTTTPVCFGTSGYDTHPQWSSVRIDNHSGGAIKLVEFGYSPGSHASYNMYNMVTLANETSQYWLSPRSSDQVGVYVWCAQGAGDPHIHNATGQGYCL